MNTHSRKQQSNNQPTNQPTKQVNSVVAPAVAARGLLQTVVSGPTLLLLGGAVAAVMYAIVSKAMAADELRRYRYHEEL